MMENAVFSGAFLQYLHTCDELTCRVEAKAKCVRAWLKCFISFFVGVKTINCFDVLRRNEFCIEKRDGTKGFAVLIEDELRV